MSRCLGVRVNKTEALELGGRDCKAQVSGWRNWVDVWYHSPRWGKNKLGENSMSSAGDVLGVKGLSVFHVISRRQLAG